MEIKNLKEMIEKLLKEKSITVLKIQKHLCVGYPLALQIFIELDDNGLVLSLSEKEKVVKKGKLKETKNLIASLLQTEQTETDENYFDENGEIEKSKLDPYFVDALKLVISKQRASVSFLQRELQIGYSRASRIIDQMEDLDFISGSNTIPRIVFITPEDFEQIFGRAV